jgi:hypothetical protein
MRITKALILGVLVMPWLADMRNLSAAIAAQQQAQYDPNNPWKGIPGDPEAQANAERMFKTRPQPLPESEMPMFESGARVGTGQMSEAQYRRNWNILNGFKPGEPGYWPADDEPTAPPPKPKPKRR